MKDKRILVDADGVLVQWSERFMDWALNDKKLILKEDHENFYWMEEKFNLSPTEGRKLVVEFNRSHHIGDLRAFRDSKKYIKRLVAEGFEFHCITAIEDRADVRDRRTKNLKHLFGDIFHDVTCVGTISSKEPYLAKYKDSGCYWIEDSVTNATIGHELGLNAIVIRHGHTKDFEHDDMHVVDSWKEIYDIISK